MDEKTTVYLSPEEATLFLQFQKRFAFMKLMDSLGAFDLKSASVEIHFDNLGAIGSIDIHRHYRTE